MSDAPNFNSLDAQIVSILLRVETFSLSDEKTLLTFNPISLLNSLDRLSSSNIIKYDDGNVTRQADFFENVFRRRHDIFKRPMKWKRTSLTEPKVENIHDA